ncbi:MAG: hypothetical protein KA974_10850 [Saprospiraceae bacterium]|nr:hypothetical protein [Saprospiraceae bacterium]
MNKKVIFTVIGFLIFFIGILSIILSMIGLHFSFLKILDTQNYFIGFLIKLVLAFGGIVIIALAQTDWTQKNNNLLDRP